MSKNKKTTKRMKAKVFLRLVISFTVLGLFLRFFVCENKALDYIDPSTADTMMWERAPLQNLAKDGQLHAYKHDGFWKCMDTQRDKEQLEEMWQSGSAPWKVW